MGSENRPELWCFGAGGTRPLAHWEWGESYFLSAYIPGLGLAWAVYGISLWLLQGTVEVESFSVSQYFGSSLLHKNQVSKAVVVWALLEPLGLCKIISLAQCLLHYYILGTFGPKQESAKLSLCSWIKESDFLCLEGTGFWWQGGKGPSRWSCCPFTGLVLRSWCSPTVAHFALSEALYTR
jgi:hypothetical protein